MKTLLAMSLVLALTACAPTSQNTSSAAVTAPSPVPAPSTPTDAAPPSTPDAISVNLLSGYHWQLASATDAHGQPIDALLARPTQPLQLDFSATGIAVSNTCNRMLGHYAIRDGKLELGALASTLMACRDPKLQALDAAVSSHLNGSLDISIVDTAPNPTLTLATAAGDHLAFKGVPTAATRYGSAGTTMFLEVAPATKPCHNPLQSNTHCLEVRELHYNAAGLREGTPGPWHVLAQPIEGYTPQPGVRNVLRVKRYAVKHPPADAPNVAYVLDMVVESHAPAH